MAQTMRFQPVTMGDDVTINPRQQACLIKMTDANGNTIELAMTQDFGAELVARTRSAFLALEARSVMEKGTTAEQRRSFASKSATIAMPFTASVNPRGTPLSAVLVTIAPASTYEQSFGLTVEWAEKLAAELQAAATQMRQDRS